MLFNSIDFLLFLPVAIFIYYLLPGKVRYIWLLIASYYFYMNWDAKYAILILISTLLTYICGIFLDRINSLEKEDDQKESLRKICLGVSFSVNLGILVYFKYMNFLIDNINQLSLRLGLDINICGLDILLPVGISFYTFQALGYTMDVYRGGVTAEKNFFKYALFVSFFPQLVAGPIERTSNLLNQLSQKHRLSSNNFRKGILWVLWGYFMKLVIADRVSIVVDTIYDNPQDYTGFYIVVATVLFGIQIYCDFNGYTMIARGCAKIMGINLMENFNAPYLSKSVAEFWRRWHISLSSWFKDYLYIPLGGNKKGQVRKYINIMVVFLVSGLWHGAAWGYMIWGGLNGIYQVIGDLLGKTRDNIVRIFSINREAFSHKLLKTMFTFALVDFSWIFFRAKSISESKTVLASLINPMDHFNFIRLFDGSLYELGLEENEFRYMLLMISILLVVDIIKYLKINITEKIFSQGIWFRVLFIVTLFWIVFLTGVYGVEYDASQFIYFQF